MYYTESDLEKQVRLETQPETITSTSQTIFGYAIRYDDIRCLIRVAELLDISLDWLLGLPPVTKTPLNLNMSNSETWHTGCPPKSGAYIAILTIFATGNTTADEIEWTGMQWKLWGAPLDKDEIAVAYWAEFPQLATPSPLNTSCKTGMSPTGHCGAAAACSSDANCCLNCGEDCNARCGWIREVQSNG